MINGDKIRKIVNDGLKAGFEIIVRDISYVLLCRMYDDREIAYKTMFPDGNDYKEYSSQEKLAWLEKYLSKMIIDEQNAENEITFEENKAAILKLIEETKKRFENNEIKAADALKIEADLRVKLNDKFKVQEEVKEKVVIVEKKYNHICKRFGVECYLPTVEDLKEMYNLTEKQ